MYIVCIANNINRNVYMYLNTRIFPTTGYARVLLFMFIRRELGGTGRGCLFQFTYFEPFIFNSSNDFSDAGISKTNTYSCAVPENFVRGGPTLTTFLFLLLFFFFVDEGREGQKTTISGASSVGQQNANDLNGVSLAW